MNPTFYNTFENKGILIPKLQRDYVQGSNVALISNFTEKLIHAVLTNQNEDLNYIYGRWIKDGTKYIPLDGQQRLTTLWILHLYAHHASLAESTFPISIIFESREYAQMFCKELSNTLGTILKENPSDSLYHSIIDQPWFQCIWLKDRTVQSMLSCLDVIRRKMKQVNDISAFYEKLKTSESITFRFYRIEGKLNDDVYIKMNGRGLPLTDFELLKSWMDGQVEYLCQGKNEWLQRWQNKLDNDWTELIWKNRNLNEKDSQGKDISFLIDDKIMRFFYNLILFYWSMCDSHHHHSKNDLCGFSDDEESDLRRKDIARLLNMEQEEDKEEFPTLIYEKLMQRFREDGEYYLPLYVLDKTNIFTKRLFIFIYTTFNELVKSSTLQEKKWLFEKNETLLNLDVGADRHKTIFHQIALNKKPSYTTLCLLYAAIMPVSKEEGGNTSFFDWMRVMRNLLLGTNITQDNFVRILNSIRRLSQLCITKNIYFLLSKDMLTEEISGFRKSQLNEEIEKAKWVCEDREWIEIFNNFENIAFCRGTIGFIFEYLPALKNKEYFVQYSSLFHLLFGKSGVRYNISKFNLQRSLMCFTTYHGFGYEKSDKWKFMDNRSEWLEFLSDRKEYEEQKHNECMIRLINSLYTRLSEKIDLSTFREEYSDTVNSELSSLINETLNKNIIKDWRYYFIKYPSVWSSMDKSMCYWQNEYHIVLLGSTQKRDGNIKELRAFAFWRDILADKNNNPTFYSGWDSLSFWYREDTCMYINHKCKSGRILALELYYEKGKADQYRLRAFFRTNNFETSDLTYTATREELHFLDEEYSFSFHEKDHKYYSPCYSYDAAMSMFKKLIERLSNL